MDVVNYVHVAMLIWLIKKCKSLASTYLQVLTSAQQYLPYCYYCRRVLILANFSDFMIIAKFCPRF